MKGLFPIAKLRQMVSVALAADSYQPAESARVRAVPDVRTIRYYTTIGIIDRPAEMRGRTALYSIRHVKQLVAIKRLQSEDLSLSDIQQRFTGISAQKLSRIAALPKGLEDLIDEPLPTPSADPTPKRSPASASETSNELEFWQQVPQSNQASSQNASIKKVLRVSLGPKATLELQTDQPIDLEKLRLAASELLDELERQNIQV